ncbi:hypothetical protein KVR01_006336 [Diaporthe batatas]|uniref:uncharacterized protein n=1 Tax=Diaporthe batatas TaxID=748121 RepID=UPI001D05A87F|nr:uncharacterized protein KVR01_006336 [Diaporthe batatas]KAG8164418.1 hypothetical protein KVR01_006336 [Diaporthe batatas]
MSIPIQATPPDSDAAYIIDQLEGERVSIPGSKGVFRILASSKQTSGGIAVFSSGAVLSDAPGFHWHAETHDIFLVTKGFLKLWNGDKCRIMGPGDFAYVPPVIIHNPELTGPHTEMLGLIAPGDWVDFFRYVGEKYEGVIVPESDDRDLKSLLIPKVMAAKDRFDVNFVRDYNPPEVGEWRDDENVLPEPLTPYFLRANTGPRQILGGILGKFAISSIESSNQYGQSAFAQQWLTFKNVHHCFAVQEGILKVRLREENSDSWNEVREGQTLLVPAGKAFVLDFGSRFVRAISFTNGPGLEEVVRMAGSDCLTVVLPEKPAAYENSKLQDVLGQVGVVAENL